MENDIWGYLVKDSYILIPVLYIIGMVVKKTPCIPDWLIPWILLVLGMAGGFFLKGMTFQGILQGVLVAGVTVLTNQLYKQTTEGRRPRR
jgi:hypothetical protein